MLVQPQLCHCSSETNASPVPFLSHINPVHSLVSSFTHFNIIMLHLLVGPFRYNQTDNVHIM